MIADSDGSFRVTEAELAIVMGRAGKSKGLGSYIFRRAWEQNKAWLGESSHGVSKRDFCAGYLAGQRAMNSAHLDVVEVITAAIAEVIVGLGSKIGITPVRTTPEQAVQMVADSAGMQGLSTVVARRVLVYQPDTVGLASELAGEAK